MKQWRCWNLVFLSLILMVSGCTSVDPAGSEKNLPIIDSITAKEGIEEDDEIIVVGDETHIIVTGKNIERVHFFANPADMDGRGKNIWIDEEGDEAWSVKYSVPSLDQPMRITALAYGKEGTDEKEIVVMRKRMDLGKELYDGHPLLPLDSGKKRGLIREVPGLPKYFAVQGWIGNNRLYGQTGTNPLVVDSNTFEYRSLGVNAWSSFVSPEGRWLAYRNEEGIHLVPTDGGKPRFLCSDNSFGAEGGLLSGGVFSPDGRNILLWYDLEGGRDYIIYQLDSGRMVPIRGRLTTYAILSHVGWVDEDTIVFTSRVGERFSNLVMFQLIDQRVVPMTSADDGVFMEGIQIVKPTIVLCRIDRKEDPVPTYAYVCTEGSNHRLLPLKSASYLQAYNEQQLAYIDSLQHSGLNHLGTLIVDIEGEKLSLAKVAYDSFSGPYWSPDGKRLAFTLTAIVPGKEKDSFDLDYRTYLVELR